MLKSYILQITISQDWINGFLISQWLWVRKTCGHILKLSWFHNSCKHNFYVTKTPKTHLRLYSHSTVTATDKKYGELTLLSIQKEAK